MHECSNGTQWFHQFWGRFGSGDLTDGRCCWSLVREAGTSRSRTLRNVQSDVYLNLFGVWKMIHRSNTKHNCIARVARFV